jgi:hypothetical protein
MSPTTLDLIARTIDWIEGHPSGGRGRPRCPTSDVIRTLEAFAGAGLCWRRLLATAERASGSTLRRRLLHWAAQAVLPRVHRVLLRMVRSGPEAAAQAWSIVVDSCSVRAKHGGELTGPNSTDRGKPSTKYHLAVSTDGLPVAAVISAANVPDTVLFPERSRQVSRRILSGGTGHLWCGAPWSGSYEEERKPYASPVVWRWQHGQTPCKGFRIWTHPCAAIPVRSEESKGNG